MTEGMKALMAAIGDGEMSCKDYTNIDSHPQKMLDALTMKGLKDLQVGEIVTPREEVAARKLKGGGRPHMVVATFPLKWVPGNGDSSSCCEPIDFLVCAGVRENGEAMVFANFSGNFRRWDVEKDGPVDEAADARM